MLKQLIDRPVESYRKVWLAAVALGAIVVVIGATLVIGKVSLGEARYRGEFAQAASIRPGDLVSVAGIQVGTVSGLELAGDRVIVRLKVRKDVHLGAETRAVIKLTTLLGSRYIELSPAAAGQLHDKTIPLSNTAVPYDLQQVLTDATTTFEQVDADKIAQSLGTLAQSLQGMPEALPLALTNLKSLSGIFAARREDLRSLLSSIDTVTSMIRQQRATLGALVRQGRDILAELASRRAALQRLFASATALVQQTRSILDDMPEINQLIADTSDLMTRISKNDALLRNTLQILPVSLRNMANATGTGMAQDGVLPAGPLIDAYMCALSGRAKQFNFPEYFQDCQPVPDPFPGFPPPYAPAAQFPGYPPETLATNTAAPPPPAAPASGTGPAPQEPPPEPPARPAEQSMPMPATGGSAP